MRGTEDDFVGVPPASTTFVRCLPVVLVPYCTNMRQERSVYFAALDGLRAFSILFVVFHHAANKPGWLTHFHGWLGVDIFFVLSGFLITFLLEQERQESGRIDLRAFYLRRAFRILPVYP